jgi:hypothetical protein
MDNPQQVWTEQLIAHLTLARDVAKRLPGNERLEVAKLNEILDLLDETKTLFLFQMELQGFKTQKISRK